MVRPVPISPALVLALAAACGEASDEARGDLGPPGGIGACTVDADCPTGLTCDEAGVCVADDGRPPEEEDDERPGARPAASARHLWVLSPGADAVTLIDTETLALRSIPFPPEPIAVATLPGEEAALVLSGGGRALSLLSRADGTHSLAVVDTGRRFDALSLAPDGSVAVLWTPDGVLPAEGAEGLVALVDVDAIRSGEAAPAVFAAGRRHEAVHFRMEAGTAVDAAIVGKGEIAVFALAGGFAPPERVPLPDAFADPATRETVAAPDGSFLLLRSLAAAELAVFDVATRALSTVPLPAPATDLDVSAEGSLALAVLRGAGQVAVLPLPAALADPGTIAFASVDLPGTGCDEPPCLHPPGQAALAPDGRVALLYSNATPTEGFARFDTADGSHVVFDRLEKWVESIRLSPDGASAVVVHRPDPDSTAADPYEREVDRANGHTAIDLSSGAAQLKLTGALAPAVVIFAAGGRFAAVPLIGADGFGLDVIDLQTLVVQPLPLASTPAFAGTLPAPTPALAHRIWVTQAHPAGRIGIARLDEMRMQTITGFALGTEVR